MSLLQILGDLPGFGTEQTRKQVEAFHSWRNELLTSIIREGFAKQLNQADGYLPKTPGERRARERRKLEAESAKRLELTRREEAQVSSDESIMSSMLNVENAENKKPRRGGRRKAEAPEVKETTLTVLAAATAASRTPVRTRARTRGEVATQKTALAVANANFSQMPSSAIRGNSRPAQPRQTRAQCKVTQNVTQMPADSTLVEQNTVVRPNEVTMVDKTVQTPTRASRANRRRSKRKAVAKKQIGFDETVNDKAAPVLKSSSDNLIVVNADTQTEKVDKAGSARPPQAAVIPRALLSSAKKALNLVSGSESETEHASEVVKTAVPKTPGASSNSGKEDNEERVSASVRKAKAKEPEHVWKVPSGTVAESVKVPESARKRKSRDDQNAAKNDVRAEPEPQSSQKRPKAGPNYSASNSMELPVLADFVDEMEIDSSAAEVDKLPAQPHPTLSAPTPAPVPPPSAALPSNRFELPSSTASVDADSDSPLLFKDEPVKSHTKKTTSKATSKYTAPAAYKAAVTTTATATSSATPSVFSNLLADTIDQVLNLPATSKSANDQEKADKPSPTFTKKRNSRSRGTTSSASSTAVAKKAKAADDEPADKSTGKPGHDSANESGDGQLKDGTRAAARPGPQPPNTRRSRERLPTSSDETQRRAMEEKTRADEERLRMLREHKEANLREKREAKRERAQLVREKRDREAAERLAKLAQRSASATRVSSGSRTSLNRSASTSSLNLNGSSLGSSVAPATKAPFTQSKPAAAPRVPRSRPEAPAKKVDPAPPSVATSGTSLKKDAPAAKPAATKKTEPTAVPSNTQLTGAPSVASKKTEAVKKPAVTAPVTNPIAAMQAKMALPPAPRVEPPKNVIGEIDFAAKLIQQNRVLIEQEAQKAKQLVATSNVTEKAKDVTDGPRRVDEAPKALPTSKPVPVQINRNLPTVAAPKLPETVLPSAPTQLPQITGSSIPTHTIPSVNDKPALFETPAPPTISAKAAAVPSSESSSNVISTSTAQTSALSTVKTVSAIPKPPLSMASWIPPVSRPEPLAIPNSTQAALQAIIKRVGEEPLFRQPFAIPTSKPTEILTGNPLSSTAESTRVEAETPARFVPPLLCSTVQHPSAVGPAACSQPLPSAIRPNPLTTQGPPVVSSSHFLAPSSVASIHPVNNHTFVTSSTTLTHTSVTSAQLANVLKAPSVVHNTTGTIMNNSTANGTLNNTKQPFDAFQCGFKPRCKVRNDLENYGIDDLSSGDDSDDELRPRKAIPAWADSNGTYLRNALLKQSQTHEWARVDAWFSRKRAGTGNTIDLDAVFAGFERRRGAERFQRRTSSAMWDSPPMSGNSTMNDSRTNESFSDSELNSSRHNKSSRKH